MDQVEPVDLLAGLRSGDWLERQTFPPLRWAVPGLIPEGLSLLIGAPKVGKSWLSLDVALSVASGGRVLGAIDVTARDVLLLALEDGDRRLRGRAHHLGHQPIPGRFHYMTSALPGTIVGTIEAWLDGLPNVGTAPLVILDTLGKAMPPTLPGEGAYQRDYRVAGRLKRIADEWPGMSLVALHHDRKGGAEDFVESVSGTNGIAGAADTILVLNRDRNSDDGVLKVTGRDVVEAEYALSTSEGRWSLAGQSLQAAAQQAAAVRSTANLGEHSARIVQYVTNNPNGVTPAEVAEALQIEAETARQYLRRLLKAGRIDQPERGVYTPVTCVTTVTIDGASTPVSDTSDTCDTPLVGLEGAGVP